MRGMEDEGGQIKLGGQLVYGCDGRVIRMMEDIFIVVNRSELL
jgi:hypothetical protein